MKTTLDIKKKEKSIKLSRCKARYKEMWFSFVDWKQDIYWSYFALFRWNRSWAGYWWKQNWDTFKLIKDWVEIDSIEWFFTSVQLINGSVYYVEHTSWKDESTTIKKDWIVIKEPMKSIYKLDIPKEQLWNSIRFLWKSINWKREVHLDDETFILDNESIYGDWMDLYTSPNGKFFIFTWFETITKDNRRSLVYSNTSGNVDEINIPGTKLEPVGYVNRALIDDYWNYVLALYPGSQYWNLEWLVFNGVIIFDWKIRMDKFEHSLDKNFSFTFTVKDKPMEWMWETFYIDSKWNIVNFPSENKDEFWIKSKGSDKWYYHKIMDNGYIEIDGKKFKRNLLN